MFEAKSSCLEPARKGSRTGIPSNPATVLANLHHIPECNYWKAMLELLARFCEGPSRSLERDLALYNRYMRRRSLCEGEKKITMRDAEARVVFAIVYLAC